MLAESYVQSKLTYQRDGLKLLLYKTLRKLLGVKGEIAAARQKVANHLLACYDSTVAYGAFRGMRLGKEVWWGKFDVSAKILGTYERQVLDVIIQSSSACGDLFIDIGAADGYFAIGVLFANLFPRAHAFEISEQGRIALARNSEANHVLNRITIDAEANFASLAQLISTNEKAVVLIDIEGGEYHLLDEEVLRLLSRSVLIVELHPWRAIDGQERQRRLLAMSERYFTVKIITGSDIGPSQFAELADFTDDERLLAFSEGRGRSMEWLVLTPKAQLAA